MKTYIYRNQVVASIREEGWKPEHNPIMSAHFQYLKDKLAKSELVLAGPCEDEAFGIVIFQAESDEVAQEFLANDPAIREGVMTAELHPFRVSLIARP